MSSLSQHVDTLKAKWRDAKADGKVSPIEWIGLSADIAQLVACPLEKVADRGQFNQLVEDGETLFDVVTNAIRFDERGKKRDLVPWVPAALEDWAFTYARGQIRDLAAKMVDYLGS